MNHHNHRKYSIENPTLAHFRHVSSLFTNLTAYKAADIYVPIRHLSSVFCLLFSVLCHLLMSRTLYKSTLFVQNKPNFKDAKMNVSSFITSEYAKVDTWLTRKTKPIQPQLKPNQTQFKPNQTQFQTGSLNHWQDEAQILLTFIYSRYTKTQSKDDRNKVDISTRLCHYI